MPRREQLAADPRFNRLAGFLLARPWLWAPNRRSVARGVACGLLVGVVPLPTQMVLAGVLAGMVQGNVAAAIAATWLTNPITAVPIWWFALQVGTLATGRSFALPEIDWLSFLEVWTWMKGLGPPLAVGLGVSGLVLAVSGYLLTMLVWRLGTLRRLGLRRRRRAG